MPTRALLVILTSAITLLAGCSERQLPGDAPIRVDLVTSPGTDPFQHAVTAATHAGLIGFDSRGQIVAQLASSWRIADDNRSVIFRLDRTAGPDSKPVDAADIVASFRRLAARASRHGAGQLLTALANGGAVLAGTAPPAALGIDAPVANVVEVRGAGVIPGLLSVLAQPDFAVTSAGPGASPGAAMRVVDPGKRPLELVRAPGNSAVNRSTLTLTATDDPGSAIARFARDRTDVVVGGGLAGFDDARLLTTSNALRVEMAWGVYGYIVHAAGPLADLRVRRALAMSIDRDDLGSRLFGVALTPVLGVVPPLPSEPAPSLPDWAIQSPSARLDLARQQLAVAGYGPAAPLTVTISLPTGREHALVAAEVASDWARIGVRTQTVVRSPAAHARAIADGAFELALVERTSPLDTALTFLEPFTCARSQICDPSADALIATARTATDLGVAVTTLASAEATMASGTPLIALFVPLRWALVSPRVAGWSGNAAGQHPLALLTIGKGNKAH